MTEISQGEWTRIRPLNRWLTVLQVPDEGPGDEFNFLDKGYAKVVPQDIQERNEAVLQGGF